LSRIGIGPEQRLQSPLCLALVLSLITRLVGLALAWVLWQQGFVPIHRIVLEQVCLDVVPMAGPKTGWMLGAWQRLDTVYYLQIATHGYSADNGTVVFSPLYSLLIRSVGAVLGGQPLFAALLISSVACVGLLVLIYRITMARFGAGTVGRRPWLHRLNFYPSLAPFVLDGSLLHSGIC
jgi:Gpi18-like mannosyltransferase